MFEFNKVYCLDCLEGMKSLDDGCVNFVFTDPPYNVGKDYGVYKDNLSPARYKIFMKKVFDEMLRVSNNRISVFFSPKLLRLFYEIIPVSFKLIVVCKGPGGMLGEKKYFSGYYCLLSTKEPIIPCVDLWKNIKLPGEGYYFKEKRFDVNPGFTSLKLTEKVIRTYTKKGDSVLDPFMGTGTTAVACKKLGRNFLGFEINPEYVKICEERLSKTYALKSLSEVFR